MIFTDSLGRRLELEKRHGYLDGIGDHDLLVMLHERMDNHIRDHARSTVTNRWMVGTLVAVFGAVVLLVHL